MECTLHELRLQGRRSRLPQVGQLTGGLLGVHGEHGSAHVLDGGLPGQWEVLADRLIHDGLEFPGELGLEFVLALGHRLEVVEKVLIAPIQIGGARGNHVTLLGGVHWDLLFY